MAFTSLHRALGLRPSALPFEMLTSAVTQHPTEEADLDWKGELSSGQGSSWREEFAKDPMSAALSQGAARRRTPGEQAGSKAAAEPEKLLTVAIPRSMHMELKALCTQAELSMKQLVMRGISHEMEAVRKRTNR